MTRAEIKRMYAEPEPTDAMVWAVCPYLCDLKDCNHCPQWEEPEELGGERCQRGCRALAEEACRVVTMNIPKDRP